jgi:anthranilate/para-aminobenzoate synthase component II
VGIVNNVFNDMDDEFQEKERDDELDSNGYYYDMSRKSELERFHGKVWNEREFAEEFEVDQEMNPCIAVIRKSDGARGSLQFSSDGPRLYFDFRLA